MLERSGKWPTDKDVCEKLKMSFLARLKESLKTTFGLMSVLHSDSLCVYKVSEKISVTFGKIKGRISVTVGMMGSARKIYDRGMKRTGNRMNQRKEEEKIGEYSFIY